MKERQKWVYYTRRKRFRVLSIKLRRYRPKGKRVLRFNIVVSRKAIEIKKKRITRKQRQKRGFSTRQKKSFSRRKKRRMKSICKKSIKRFVKKKGFISSSSLHRLASKFAMLALKKKFRKRTLRVRLNLAHSFLHVESTSTIQLIFPKI